MIAIIDYGMGNLRSVQKAMERAGAQAKITQKPEDIAKASKIILPGVGAMRPAMEKLDGLGLIPAVKKAIGAGKPFLGICLGLQLLFEKSNEGGDVKGLGILKGKVERFSSAKQKVPHMGWNQLKFKKDGEWFIQRYRAVELRLFLSLLFRQAEGCQVSRGNDGLWRRICIRHRGR